MNVFLVGQYLSGLIHRIQSSYSILLFVLERAVEIQKDGQHMSPKVPKPNLYPPSVQGVIVGLVVQLIPVVK